MNRYLIVALSLFGCGQAVDPQWARPTSAPDFYTDHGVAIYLSEPDSGFTSQALSTIETNLLTNLSAKGWDKDKSIRAMTETVVEIYPAEMTSIGCIDAVTGEKSTCTGEEKDGVVHLIMADCVAGTAYGHELSHYIRQQITGDPDAKHLDTNFWNISYYLGQLGNWNCQHDWYLNVCSQIQGCDPNDFPAAPQPPT